MPARNVSFIPLTVDEIHRSNAEQLCEWYKQFINPYNQGKINGMFRKHYGLNQSTFSLVINGKRETSSVINSIRTELISRVRDQENGTHTAVKTTDDMDDVKELELLDSSDDVVPDGGSSPSGESKSRKRKRSSSPYCPLKTRVSEEEPKCLDVLESERNEFLHSLYSSGPSVEDVANYVSLLNERKNKRKNKPTRSF